ncbi:MAG: hypothetical protein DRN15_01620 [Thermoprotei archaeon]|nr:MAG: hypothetical protein DRN15_01620 [Thermoprotei archaeon]
MEIEMMRRVLMLVIPLLALAILTLLAISFMKPHEQSRPSLEPFVRVKVIMSELEETIQELNLTNYDTKVAYGRPLMKILNRIRRAYPGRILYRSYGTILYFLLKSPEVVEIIKDRHQELLNYTIAYFMETRGAARYIIGLYNDDDYHEIVIENRTNKAFVVEVREVGKLDFLVRALAYVLPPCYIYDGYHGYAMVFCASDAELVVLFSNRTIILTNPILRKVISVIRIPKSTEGKIYAYTLILTIDLDRRAMSITYNPELSRTIIMNGELEDPVIGVYMKLSEFLSDYRQAIEDEVIVAHRIAGYANHNVVKVH